MQYWPKGTPVHRQKGQKTRISPYKRTIAYAELLAIICGVKKASVLKYFSNRWLEIANPRAVRKFLEERLEKYWNLIGEKKNKTKYTRPKEPEKPIQGPSKPNERYYSKYNRKSKLDEELLNSDGICSNLDSRLE